MSFTQNTTAQSRALTAFFDTKGAAQQAVSDIEGAGVPRHDITMVEGATAAAGMTSAPAHEGFLTSLKDMFMPEEDRYAYAEGLRRGGYLVSVKTGQVDTDRLLDILDRDGAVDMDGRETTWRGEGWKGYQTPAAGKAASSAVIGTAMPQAATNTSRTEGEELIPIYEERLDIGKREVSHGRLRVRSYVVEKAVNEQVTLRTESVQVDRHGVDRAVTATDDMFQDRTIELEEFAEEAIVSKEARVVEEISLRKEVKDRTETIRDTVRHTEIEIEDGRTATGVVGTHAVREGSDDGRVVEHMQVFASDGAKVGTVDHMDGPDRIRLAKNTSPDGQHHHVPMAWVDHVDEHVHLKKTADEVKAGW
ncbi:MAG: DUF2171 domain-containing protein [Janthinobacterium lividum]